MMNSISDIDKRLLYLHDTTTSAVKKTKEDEITTFIKNEIEKVAHLINDEQYIEEEAYKGYVYLQDIYIMMDAYNKNNDESLDNTIERYISEHQIKKTIATFEKHIIDAKGYYIKEIKNLQNIPVSFNDENKTLASLFE